MPHRAVPCRAVPCPIWLAIFDPAQRVESSLFDAVPPTTTSYLSTRSKIKKMIDMYFYIIVKIDIEIVVEEKVITEHYRKRKWLHDSTSDNDDDYSVQYVNDSQIYIIHTFKISNPTNNFFFYTYSKISICKLSHFISTYIISLFSEGISFDSNYKEITYFSLASPEQWRGKGRIF